VNSVIVLEKLLMFQFKNDILRIKQFLHEQLTIVDKSMLKCNCLYIFVLGEPNSGKNFFFDCLIHFFVNFGFMANWNKYNQFHRIV